MSQRLMFVPPAISVDIEDWPQSTWDRQLPVTGRVVENTHRVLRVLSDANVKATMFVLGKVAVTFPGLVREMKSEGHEIASHGHGHVEIFRQSPQEFAADVRQSKDVLEQILGERVRGYRAPDFSIVRESLWALPILCDAGFDYDSSIFPVRRARYGIPEWPASPVRVVFPDRGAIVEAPVATVRFWSRNWPIGGGGYHRLFPGFVSRYLASRAMVSMPFVFYCHPYELDPDEFDEIGQVIPWQVRLHQGLGRGRFGLRLSRFLRRFGGRRIGDLIDGASWPDFCLLSNDQRAAS